MLKKTKIKNVGLKMKFLDKVEVVSDNANYNKNNVYKGMVGTIIDAEIRDNCFNVLFIDERVKDKKFMANEKNLLDLKDDIVYPIKIKDEGLVGRHPFLVVILVLPGERLRRFGQPLVMDLIH